MKLEFPVMGTSYTVNSYRVGDAERLGLCDMDLQSKCCQAHHFFLYIKGHSVSYLPREWEKVRNPSTKFTRETLNNENSDQIFLSVNNSS